MRLKRFKKLFRKVMGSADGRPLEKRLGPSARVLHKFLVAHQIANVIDVGANTGQFAAFLRRCMAYQGQIISIEPLPDAFARLQATAATDERWSVLNLALGESNTVLPLNIAGNSGSSSILPMLDRHVQSAPDSAYVGRVDVPVRRLDSLPELRAAARGPCLLKIDAQGYEQKILHGAEGMMDAFSLLYLECSLVPLYEGGPLIEELIAYLRQKGYAPVDISRGHSDRVSGQQLQADILFAKV